MVKKVIVLCLCFLLPTRLLRWILMMFGHRIHTNAKIGFSLLWIDNKIDLRNNSQIGGLNLIKVDRLTLHDGARIGSRNKLNGPINIELAEMAEIGNSNKIYRAPEGVTYGSASLKLGVLSKITAHHRIDCTRSISMGNYSILAGHESQLWTHAYYHDKTGPGRFRLDGEIYIGDNVYVGSRCVINCGVKITDGVIVGANSCVSKSLLKPGMYVSQALRFIEENTDQRSRFKRIEGYTLCEEVFEKNELPPS